MNTTFDTLSATAALVGSLGQHPHDEAPEHPVNLGALKALREAEVELYCDHDAAALIALREARRDLCDTDPASIGAMTSLEEAAWHVRRHETRAAHAAIEKALGQLA